MNGIRVVLSPLLSISYVLGIRIIEFPMGKPRQWCSFLYILLLWAIYHILVLYTIIHLMSGMYIIYKFCFWLNIWIALLSAVLGIYHDKKYRTCLRQLDIVDDTLEKIEVTTNYQKLYKKMLLTIFGWFAYILCTTCASSSCTLGYIGLKFEQLNEYLRKLNEDNGHGLKQAWEHSALLPCQIEYLKFTSSESATWIAMYHEKPV
ncbi:uncharacterized protein LOC116849193 [Odontomachus brunneus]|uniref:uncharacterized protein LOC116849193 n=1 Tax=Odontomachus brunneus TaxID=486640 RepID=UPI0013F213D8|nr:uncharacterized protein LOC116849193 [Odontomachus brunneus]